ncbi:MAG: adenylate/guanylate cyclase domain-containing protein [Hyphomicrobiaceae bacterium]|nr:adenylate/guanylate cyclase domain-containing protein [Hyphomicrobiaceae bacterium]
MTLVTDLVERARAAMRPAGPQLPGRVQRLVDAQEQESERLIGWVQLLVVGLFATLFTVAPRPDDAPMSLLLEPVPVALAAYFAFTVARLFLAYRGPLPGPVLLASIVADVGLLVGLIWSFHGQYGQTAPFSLKVPTFVYLFVFIAVRVLRLDVRFVVAAGLAAALGWIGLVAAVLSTSGTGVITRSFAEHLNHNRVLIGAEIDKVVTLLLVTGVLALAVVRCRRLLLTAVRGEAAVADLRRFLGQGVSDAVVDAEAVAMAGLAHERDAAILMLDIRGFTRLSARLSPQSVVEVITSLHARIIPAVRRHGGVVDKFMGDGIMVTFGAVRPSRTAAADALAALEAATAEAEAWKAEGLACLDGERLAVNGAVAAGRVVFAVVGALDRLEYTVIGEAVNLAAKLEKHNKAEGTCALTTMATFALAEEQGFMPRAAIERRPQRRVSGVDDAIDLVSLA